MGWLRLPTAVFSIPHTPVHPPSSIHALSCLSPPPIPCCPQTSSPSQTLHDIHFSTSYYTSLPSSRICIRSHYSDALPGIWPKRLAKEKWNHKLMFKTLKSSSRVSLMAFTQISWLSLSVVASGDVATETGIQSHFICRLSLKKHSFEHHHEWWHIPLILYYDYT